MFHFGVPTTDSLVPTGCLWLTIGDTWYRWCKDNDHDKYEWRHEMDVDMARLIVVQPHSVDEFVCKYGRMTNAGSNMIDLVRDDNPDMCGVYYLDVQSIKWSDPRKFTDTWFYGRDVDSVAIWSADCIRGDIQVSRVV